jgi:hypothetical protein
LGSKVQANLNVLIEKHVRAKTPARRSWDTSGS